jgi:hypothetical protein
MKLQELEAGKVEPMLQEEFVRRERDERGRRWSYIIPPSRPEAFSAS